MPTMTTTERCTAMSTFVNAIAVASELADAYAEAGNTLAAESCRQTVELAKKRLQEHLDAL